MTLLQHARRDLARSLRRCIATIKANTRDADAVPFVVELLEKDIPPWLSDNQLREAVSMGVRDAVMALSKRRITPGHLLARKNLPPAVRSAAARAMLAMRGGRATAKKMSPLGYPNLVKAREALRCKVAEQKVAKAAGSLPGKGAQKPGSEQWPVGTPSVSVGPRTMKFH
jgi:hypothetical protein